MHIPVLLKETIAFLDPQPGEFIIDGTVGSAGHAKAILNKIGPTGKLLGVDWDSRRIENCELRIADCKNVVLIQGNYADLSEILRKEKESDPSTPLRASGLLLDLGFSSEQLESGRAPKQSKLATGRGFSFLKDEPLIMRYQFQEVRPPEIGRQYLGGRTSQVLKNGLTAADVVNNFSEKELSEIFWKYGEERFSRKIAKNIVIERKKRRIMTTFELVEIIKKSVPKNYERGRIHFATRVFQALRIYVNDELGNLERLLANLPHILKSGGRAVIISFHSLEDRLVKNYFRNLEKEGMARILTKKPVRPSQAEIQVNPRSRSAKLRAIEIKS